MLNVRGSLTIRFLRLAVLAGFLSACSGAPASPGASAPNSAVTNGPSTMPTGTAEPADSLTPVETAPATDGPLPAPTLASADEIVAAIAVAGQEPQVVVSMLQLLGVGLYNPDGTPIRAGTATTDNEFYAFEPEARGLVAMLRSRNQEQGQLSFRAFHAALKGLGFTGTAEQLATAYKDAYAADPTAFVSELVTALGGVDVDGSISSFEEWLLLVDGFVPPNSAATATADTAGPIGPVAFGGGYWGVARATLQSHGLLEQALGNMEFGVRLLAIANTGGLVVTATPTSIHEGHNRARGAPMQAVAHVVVGRQRLISPFDGNLILSGNPAAENVTIEWSADAAAAKHGTLDQASSSTDRAGNADVTYLPIVEAADGAGSETEEDAHIHASFDDEDYILQLYGSVAEPYMAFIKGTTTSDALFYARWHEKISAEIKIVWTDTYGDIDDVMTFLGKLDTSRADPISGTVYIGEGTVTGKREGWAKCNPGIDVVPEGTVPAVFQGYLTDDGELVVAAWADYGSVLSGVSTEAFIVPLGQNATYQNEPHKPIGDLCPHGSHGEITVTDLVIP